MIYYFSGTGNSRAVAVELSKYLAMSVCDIATVDSAVDFRDEQTVVWVVPIYSWGLPPVVVDFIERICTTSESSHYLVCTCGDDIGRADRQWTKLLKKIGLNPKAAFSVQMPNTYTLLPGFDVDNRDVEHDKLMRMPGRVKEVADAILRGDACSDVVAGGVPSLKSGVVYPLFRRFGCSTRYFAVTDACVGCGLCVENCPKDNMSMENGTPHWGNDCTMCLRCYHICPHNAVRYGKVTTGKGQYRTLIFRNITADNAVEPKAE